MAAQRRRVAIASRQALCCSRSGISYGLYGIGKAHIASPRRHGWQRRASKRRASKRRESCGKAAGRAELFRSAPKARAWRHQMLCGVGSGLGDRRGVGSQPARQVCRALKVAAPMVWGTSSGLEIAKNFLGQDLVDLTVPENGLGANGLLQFSDQFSSFQVTTSSPILRITGRSCLENSW